MHTMKQRQLRRALLRLCVRCQKLSGAAIAVAEQLQYGHELDTGNVAHLYGRLDDLYDAWVQLTGGDLWRSVDVLSDDDEEEDGE